MCIPSIEMHYPECHQVCPRHDKRKRNAGRTDSSNSATATTRQHCVDVERSGDLPLAISIQGVGGQDMDAFVQGRDQEPPGVDQESGSHVLGVSAGDHQGHRHRNRQWWCRVHQQPYQDGQGVVTRLQQQSPVRYFDSLPSRWS